MNKGKFHEKEELLRVIFMPINNRLRAETGSSLVEVVEEDLLFVSFITGRGNIKIKCNAKRFMITEFSVECTRETVDFILLRFTLFLRRNDTLVISVLQNDETRNLQDFLEMNYPDILLKSFGTSSYLELKVMDYIIKAAKRLSV